MDFAEFKTKFQKEKVEEFPNRVNSKPLVSILILTYNHNDFISQCLDSILEQEVNFEFEVLLSDDESDDGTREICLNYANDYPEIIRFFKHKKTNNIQINKLNTGIFNALYSLYQTRGQYIAYCDGDDYWGDKSKIQSQVNFLEKHSDYILTYHSVNFRDNQNCIIQKEGHLNRDLNSEDLKKVIQQPLLNTICFRNKIKKYPVEMTTILNSDNFLISLLGHYGKGKFLASIQPSTYRIHQRGIWSMISKEEKFLFKIQSLKALSKHYQSDQKKLSKYFKKEVYKYQKSLVFLNWTNKEYFKTAFNLLNYFAYLSRSTFHNS